MTKSLSYEILTKNLVTFKNFSIIGVPWKNWFLKGGHEELTCLQREAWTDLRRGLHTMMTKCIENFS